VSSTLYFAYGSNLDEEQMRVRCPDARALFRARLADHRLDFTHYSTRWQGGTADIVPAPGEFVYGLVYRMSPSCFARLDPFEGGYARITLRVHDDSGEAHEAQSYAVRERGGFAPHPRYLAQILAGAERLAFPDAYRAALLAFTTTLRPPRPR
jgi:gamma-glutamylcyclotransferase (GGCT)/AIG2-like uncharacterized protein YtfP